MKKSKKEENDEIEIEEENDDEKDNEEDNEDESTIADPISNITKLEGFKLLY